MNGHKTHCPVRTLYATLLPLLIGIQYSCYRPYPPARPGAVAVQAVWAGGLDGGSYVLCDIVAGSDLNRCTVWNDTTGRIEEEGTYRLLRGGRVATLDELKPTWADRSGRIGLKDNKVLAKAN